MPLKTFPLLLCLLQLCAGITVSDETLTATTSKATAQQQKDPATYRLSLAQTQLVSNRVPVHLQRVRPQGYHYDDADDVIHIVAPPQHFQQLKRLVNQGQDTAWQQQPLRIDRAPDATKVKERPPHAAKVNMPLKPVIVADLLTQETQQQQPQQQLVAHLAFPAGLPLQIVASVRKTQRLLHKQQPLVPHAKQRIQTRTTHTLLNQQRFEQQQFERGQQQHLRSNTLRRVRVKRQLPPPADHEIMAELQARKRQIEQTTTKAKQVHQKGQQLLLHIIELLQNASYYLPAGEAPQSATLRELRQRFQADTQPKRLIGELEPVTRHERPKAKTHEPLSKEHFNLLEQTVNSTDVIMRHLMRRQQASSNKRQRAATFASNSTGLPTLKRGTSAALLYADVMANIQNMLHARNMQLLEQQHYGPASTAAEDADTSRFTAASPRNKQPTQVQQSADFKDLQQYLEQLQQLFQHLPQNATQAHELEAGSSSRSKRQPDWYLINGEGKIFGSAAEAQFKTTASMFHRFPDMPNAELLLANRTLAPDQPHAYEVL